MIFIGSNALEHRCSFKFIARCIGTRRDPLMLILLDEDQFMGELEGACPQWLACSHRELLPFLQSLQESFAFDQSPIRVSGPPPLIGAYHHDLPVLIADSFDHTIWFPGHSISPK